MQISLWDESVRLEKLSQLGDSLEKLNRVVNWEMFRPRINKAMKAMKHEAKGPGGRPPYDNILLFKILVLQRVYNLSDDQTEYQINDRMSFMRFLGLGLGDRVPDAKTIWLFRDTLTKANVIRDLFEIFNKQLEDAKLITHTGSIVDATFVEAPKPNNNREERQDIKDGKVPEEWKKPENKNKLRQKDTDARWTRKANKSYYGYKNHIKADKDSKLIVDYTTTHAAVHDSQEVSELVDEKDNVIYGDSAYWGKKVAENLPKNVESQIHERGTKHAPLTEEQKASNKIKSKTRARVEHVFGFMENSMNGITLRSIGLERAKFNIGLTNLIYNLFRFEFLNRSKAAA